uniref:PINc domain-containing protein n=1 Tax=Anopheles christyi TaxID=43041 RepID=A0A182K655_9DIPT
MSSKRSDAATPPEKRMLWDNKTIRSPKPQEADCSKTDTPSPESNAETVTPRSKIAHRLCASFTPPKPGALTTLASGADTQLLKETNASKSRRSSAPTKPLNTASTSSKSDKTLSTIVKAKNKKAKGLPVAWRAELYGTRPGSAQARLEQLCAALHKEVEEQKLVKTVASIPQKRTAMDREGPPKKKVTIGLSQATASASVTPVTIVPVSNRASISATAARAETIIKPLSIVTDTRGGRVLTEPAIPEDSHDMDVDDVEMNSPVALVSTAVVRSDSMECDHLPEPNMPQKPVIESKPSTNNQRKIDVKADTKKEANDESKKAMSDLKTKYKDGLSAFSSYFYCIIDTNIFIEHYQLFQNFLSKKYKACQPIVVVPYKVLHELDTVKHKKPELVSKIVPVVKFLHQMLRAKDARVKGQHPWDDTIELMPVLSPDDSIINCALQVQMAAAGGHVQVVLVSNDCNMLTKALVANLNSCTMEELKSDYNF